MKFPYAPSEKKRFEISRDEYSRERLATIKSFYEEMSSSFDISMGLSLFGSLAKGKELDAEKKDFSDVDFTLYIDIDEYRQKYIENLRRNKSFAEFEYRQLDGFCRDFSERKIFNSGIRKIQEGHEFTSDEKEFFERRLQRFTTDWFIFFLAVWHEYAHTSDLRGDNRNFIYRGKQQPSVERMRHLVRIKDVQAWPIQYNGEFSIRNQVRIAKNALEDLNEDTGDRKEKEYILDQERCGIARMFGLDVGGGMKKYRQDFIRELLLLGGEGEELWNIVSDSVRIRERDNLIPKNIEKQFPKTLEEAVRYYSVNPT